MQSLRFLFAFVLAFVATQLNAQIYVIDSQWPDSVVAHTYKWTPDRSAEVEDMTTIKLAQGDPIKVLRALEGNPTMFSGNIASRPASSGAPRMYEGANGQKFQNSHDAWSHRQQQNNININNKNRGWW